jgi:type II secretory ATPase GspE/PulE/Tfp pilus assembly ATPase PilB-like protein
LYGRSGLRLSVLPGPSGEDAVLCILDSAAPLALDRAGLPAPEPGRDPDRPVGCEACAGTGFRGRLGIYELFVPDEELADQIAHGEPANRLRIAARDRGMRTLLDDALAKARAGLVPLSEILQAVPYRMLEGR